MSDPKTEAGDVDQRLARMYTETGDKQAKYDLWADHYEADLIEDLDYVAHLRASEIFSGVVNDRDAHILDLGCGTGLVGATLREMGYTRVDGADFSGEMLEIAAQRDVYGSISQQDVTRPLALEFHYDALISVGLFAFGSPAMSDLHNAVNCVGRGCPCIITVNGKAWSDHNLEAALNQEAEAHWFTVEQVIETEYIRKEGITGQVLVITR